MSDTTVQSPLGPPPPSVSPFSSLEPEPPAVGTASVVTGRRIVAGLLDFLPMLALMIAIGERDGASVRLSGLPVLWWLLAGIAYYAVGELLTGTSPGKAVVGLCVRQLDATEATRKQIVVRTSLRIIDVIAGYLVGLIVALTSPKRQRIGDRVAGTVVLQRAEVTKDKFPARSTIILTTLVVATFAASALLYAQSVEDANRLGGFDIQSEVVPYANQVIEDGFRPASTDNIRAYLFPGLVSDADLERTVELLVGGAGELTDGYEMSGTETVELRLDRDLSADVVNVSYDVEFENGPGQLVLAVADVNGDMMLVGFRFWLF